MQMLLSLWRLRTCRADWHSVGSVSPGCCATNTAGRRLNQQSPLLKPKAELRAGRAPAEASVLGVRTRPLAVTSRSVFSGGESPMSRP